MELGDAPPYLERADLLAVRKVEDRLRYGDASKAPSAAAPTGADATAEEIETLRALGYVE